MILAENIGRALVATLGAKRGKELFDRVVERYTLTAPADVLLNLALREHWRLQHGNTTAWDAAALAAGFNPTLYERS